MLNAEGGRGTSIPVRSHSTSDAYGQRKAGPHQKVKNPKVVKESRFLRDVQDELEEQRTEWKDEVEKMIEGLRIERSMSGSSRNGPKSGLRIPDGQAKNGFVDQSSGNPIFRAFVDVSEYPASGVAVTVDKLQGKMIVTAKKPAEPGNVTRTFTQKVTLPRYADEPRIRTRLNKDGILCVEVPLMFYFEPEKKTSKSFINQVKSSPSGGKCIEILVNVGSDMRPWELKIRVNEKNELLIHAERERSMKTGDTLRHRQLIKRYILPENADVNGISSHLGKDGRLVVNVPLSPYTNGTATI